MIRVTVVLCDSEDGLTIDWRTRLLFSEKRKEQWLAALRRDEKKSR